MDVIVKVFQSSPNYTKAKSVTSSLNVADAFGKRHDHLLRSIENLISPKTGALNKEIKGWFSKGEYTDSRGRKQTMYLMNRDGFTLLTMGFTGEKALKFKVEYIKRFNEMEDALYNQKETRGLAIAVRKSLTDAIKNNLDTTKPFVYSNYTRLAVKKAFGKSIEEMRQIYSVNKECNLRDYLCAGDLARLDYMEGKIASMVDALKILGMSDKEIYSRIKNAGIK